MTSPANAGDFMINRARLAAMPCGGHRFREPTVRRLVAYGLIEAPDEFPTSV